MPRDRAAGKLQTSNRTTVAAALLSSHTPYTRCCPPQDPLIALGFRTRLEPEHMCPDPSLATQRLYNNLEPAWREQQAKEKPDLKRALLRGNMRTLLLTAVLYLVAQACSLAGPLLLREIVTGLQCEAAQRRVPVDIGCKPRKELYLWVWGGAWAGVGRGLEGRGAVSRGGKRRGRGRARGGAGMGGGAGVHGRAWHAGREAGCGALRLVAVAVVRESDLS